jgi:hypothetical protein
MRNCVLIYRILLILVFYFFTIIFTSCDPNSVQADDHGSFDISGHFNDNDSILSLQLTNNNTTYTDSTMWPLNSPTFDWTIKEPRRVRNNNQPDRVRYDNQPLLHNTTKWSHRPHDSLLTGTDYFYFSGTCTNSSGIVYNGYSREGLNFFRISLPDPIFNNNYYDPYLDTASTYLGVPYVSGSAIFVTTLGDSQIINKAKRQGYCGTDCSGLVNWTLLKNGNPLGFGGIDSVIVDNNNAHSIWQQKVAQGLISCGWGIWCDGVVYFLDSDNDNIVDHVGFWFDNASTDGQTIHAQGGDVSKVVFADLDPRYHSSWLYDAVDIYNQTERREKNEFVKK